jgi:hypothetical protein
MSERIDEEVSVDLVFDSKTKVSKPWVVRWRGRIYKVTQIGLHYQQMIGKVLVHVFSVCAGEMFFKLKFDTSNLHWKLEEVSQT